MSLLVGVLNGRNIQEDYQRNAAISALAPNGGIGKGLTVTYGSGDITISKGFGFCKVKRGDMEFMVDFWVTVDHVITAPSVPCKVWIEIDETKVASGLENNVDGTGVVTIKTGAAYPTYPTKFFLALCNVSGAGVVTVDSNLFNLSSGIVNIVLDSIQLGSNLGDIIANSITLPGGNIQTQIDNILASGLPVGALSDKDTYILGEDCIKNDALFAETAPVFSDANGILPIGNIADNTRVSFRKISNGMGISSINLGLQKFTSPSSNLTIRLESDNNGIESGIQLEANTIASINPASLTTTPTNTNIVFSATSVTNSHGVTLNSNETSQTIYKGFKYTLTTQCSFINVTKVAGCTSTKCYLYDLDGNLLTSATFSSNIATLNYDGLINGTSYYIGVGSDGSSYTSVKQTGATAYPYTLTKMNLINGFSRSNGATDSVSVGYSGQFGFPVTLTTTFTATINCKLSSVGAGSNATLYDDATNTVLETSTSNIFSGNTLLQSGTTYRIVTSYPAYGIVFGYGSVTPVVGTNITITNSMFWSGSIGSCSITTSPAINEDTNIYNIASISTSDNVYIPDGTPYHIVCYVGTYGSEVVNSTNYYGISCKNANTTVSPARLYNGTTWVPKNIYDPIKDDSVVSTNYNYYGTYGMNLTITPIEDCMLLTQSSNNSGLTLNGGGYTGITSSTPNILLIKGVTYTVTASPYTSYVSTANTITNNNVTISVTSLNQNSNYSITTQRLCPYICMSSSSVYPTLLSKIDAKYIEKLPKDFARISNEIKKLGQRVITTFLGLKGGFIGLSPVTYYASNIPGLISATQGTHPYIIGNAIDSTTINVNGKNLNRAITVSASPFSYTNTTGGPIQVSITGGTVNPIVINGVTTATATNHINTLPAGATMTITYTALPTVTYSNL